MGILLEKRCNVKFVGTRGGGKRLSNKNDNSMYELYREYEETLKMANKTLRKRQGINADLRDEHKSPFNREDYNLNKSDITNWNSMIRDLEEDMKMMEMYLDFEDRKLLHRDYNNTKSMILNKRSHEGEIPLECLYNECVPDTTDIVCNIETQEEIVELLDEVLTQRQKQIVDMHYWQNMTQERISKELGIAQQNVSVNLQNAIKSLRKYIKASDICLDIDFKEF